MSTNSEQFSRSVRIRLSAMMFLQYMLFAVWWVQLAAYLNNLGFTGLQQAWIFNTMALGCLFSPLVGMIADRHMASQKVLCIFNIISGVLLFWGARQTDPTKMFIALLIQQLCYMPTWGLTNSIAMANSPTDKFPLIRAFGSFGWVAAGIFSLCATLFFYKTIDGTRIPIYIGAIICIIAGFNALTLPNTPPPAKGKKASVIDALGLRAATLMKDFHFSVFVIISLLVMIPFVLYFNFGSRLLMDEGFKFLTFTMGLGQVGEIFFMLLIPLVLARMGLKWAMSIGLLAMLVRYAAFLLGYSFSQIWLFYLAILVHGIIFGFFFVGGQMYIAKKAPKEILASAQGFIFLVTFAIGMFAGNHISGFFLDINSTKSVEVANAFKLPVDSAFPKNMFTVKGGKASDIKIYNRALNETEESLLAANKKQAKFIKESAEETFDLKKGVVYSGDNLSSLANVKVPGTITFSAKFTMPDEGKLVGDLFSCGSGGNALKIYLDKETGCLIFKAGDKKIEAKRVSLASGKDDVIISILRSLWRRVLAGFSAKKVSLASGKDDKGKVKTTTISGTFDGKNIKLFVNGSAYVMTNWTPIFNISTIFSLVLLIVFLIFFNDKTATKPGGAEEETETETAGESPGNIQTED